MKRESGSRNCAIWLIGDSSPERWERELDEPLDTRHPTRHNIWTPILEGIQAHLYVNMRKRLRTERIYIRNAVHYASEKPPSNGLQWPPSVESETRKMRHLLEAHRPRLVFSFGAFAFEFARRSRHELPHRACRHWTTEKLGQEFRRRISYFAPDEYNLIPLLHVSIARGRFLSSHRNFTGKADGNYFDCVAEQITNCLCKHPTKFPID